MKVFVTGSTGLIGTRIVQQLVKAGHTVTALARSAASASKVESLGATPIHGAHTDLDVLRDAASSADAVIHCAFNNGLIFTGPDGYALASKEDRAAVTAMCDALVGTGKTFVNSSNLARLVDRGVEGGADERSEKIAGSDPAGLRGLSENLVASYADKGVRGTNIRLPPVVHSGDSEHGFLTMLIAIAKQRGFSGYVDDGKGVWSSTHVWDAAALYVLALTADNVKPGANLHGAFELNIPTKEIAEYIGERLGLETKSVPIEEAGEHFGPFMGALLQEKQKMTNELTVEWTGWKPSGQPKLFEDMEAYKF